MSANPIVLGRTQQAALVALRQKAAAEPIDVRAVQRAVKTPPGMTAHLKRMAGFSIEIPVAYSVTFTLESGHPVGLCRHLSMSSHRRGKVPTPEAVWLVAEELGFAGGFDACLAWLEDIGDGEKAVNLVQPVAARVGEGAPALAH